MQGYHSFRHMWIQGTTKQCLWISSLKSYPFSNPNRNTPSSQYSPKIHSLRTKLCWLSLAIHTYLWVSHSDYIGEHCYDCLDLSPMPTLGISSSKTHGLTLGVCCTYPKENGLLFPEGEKMNSGQAIIYIHLKWDTHQQLLLCVIHKCN